VKTSWTKTIPEESKSSLLSATDRMLDPMLSSTIA